MSYTFSDNHEVDYPALGMCDTCGKRFTQGCEHSNTLEAQQWLAAYAATEQSRDNVEYFLETQKDNQPAAVTAYEAEFMDGFYDPQLNNHDIAVDVAAYNVHHAIPANKEWAERRLVEETEKRNKYIRGDTNKV